MSINPSPKMLRNLRKKGSFRSLPATMLCGCVLVFCGRPLLAEDFSTNVIAGEYFNAGATVYVGDSGSFNLLSIVNNGWLEDQGAIIGNSLVALNNSAVVSGLNSLWDTKGALIIGRAGSSNQLSILDRARGSAYSTAFGAEPSSSNNIAHIAGAAIWNCGELELGAAGSGNIIGITDGGGIYAGPASVGFAFPSSNNALIVAGQASFFIAANLYIGSYGSEANQLIVSNTAQVYDTFGFLGNGNGNRALITDNGSLWQSDDVLFIGTDGADNQLTIRRGGRVQSLGGFISGDSNAVLVADNNSVWETGGNNSQLILGDASAGNRLIITDGGRVNSWDAIITGDANFAAVNGPASVWANANSLFVGEQFQTDAELSISNGATVTAVGATMAGDEGRLFVSGFDSTLNASGDFTLGDEYGARNRLVVALSGALNAARSYIGGTASGFVANQNINNSALVTGAGSTWNNTGDLIVGATGAGNQLTVTDGGVVRNKIGYLGLYGSSAANTVLVSGINSRWTNSQDLFIGYSSSGNTLVVTNGAEAHCANAWVGHQGSQNNLALIGGTNSVWRVNGLLQVGNAGSFNKMVITTGARVDSLSGLIDSVVGARSNLVVVSGADSTWANHGFLTIGANSSLNHLLINDNAAVITDGLAVGNLNLSLSNIVVIAAGHLIVTNSAGSSSLSLQRGALILNGGELTCDRLTADDGVETGVSFSAGTLRARSITFSAPRAFSVGNGIAPASLSLQGPVHRFAGGLNILANASLVAAGILNGRITNAGSFDVGAPAGALTLNGDLYLADSSSINFDLGGGLQGTQYDFIGVSNSVHFGGVLRVSLLANFVPASNSVFELMRFNGGSGAFANAPSGSRITLENSTISCQVDYVGSSLLLSQFEGVPARHYDVDEAWATTYFGHSPLTQEELQADADGDGASNYAEYRAGTDPKNSDSVLKIASVTLDSSGNRVIRFQCVTNKNYAIAYSSDLIFWADITAPSLTFLSAGVCQWVDDGSQTQALPAGSARFYRVAIR